LHILLRNNQTEELKHICEYHLVSKGDKFQLF
jgi:hypothetical protein